MRPIVLRFSLGFAALQVAVAALGAWISFSIAIRSDWRSNSGRWGWLVDLDVASGGWVLFLLFGTLGMLCLYGLGIAVWRFSTNVPALVIYEDRVVVHPSFWRTPGEIKFKNGVSVAFGRVDKIQGTSANWGARQVQECQTLLEIVYLDGARSRKIKVFGPHIEGSAWQVGRAAVAAKRGIKNARKVGA